MTVRRFMRLDVAASALVALCASSLRQEGFKQLAVSFVHDSKHPQDPGLRRPPHFTAYRAAASDGLTLEPQIAKEKT